MDLAETGRLSSAVPPWWLCYTDWALAKYCRLGVERQRVVADMYKRSFDCQHCKCHVFACYTHLRNLA